MSKIKSKNTKPEVLLRKELWSRGIRYRIHNKNIPGSPDISIKKHKIAIFVDGEFWHGYNWEEKKQKIKSNKDYWIPKIEKNIERDNKINETLNKKGWKIIRFWTSDINNNLDKCIDIVMHEISLMHQDK